MLSTLETSKVPKTSVYFISYDGPGVDLYGDLLHFPYHVFQQILCVYVSYVYHAHYRSHFDAFSASCHSYF